MATKKTEPSGLYILQDGTQADPGACKKGDDGVWRHENGLAVILGSDGEPATVGGVAEEGGNVAAAEAGKPKDEEAPAADAAAPSEPAA